MSEPFSKYEMESNIDTVCVSSIIEIELKEVVIIWTHYKRKHIRTVSESLQRLCVSLLNKFS